jgi:hypothetical protein
MKKITLFLCITNFLFATNTVTYERYNDDAVNLVPELFSGINSLSLSAIENESTALYKLSHTSNTIMSLCYSTTLEGIEAHGGASKLSKYTLVAPVKKGQLHLIVPIRSRFKSIYDLERHNVSMDIEGTATDLIAQTLFLDAKITVSAFHYDLNEAMRRLIGGGLDAVVALGKSPIDVLQNYQGKFKLITVPASSGHKSVIINGSSYGLSTNTPTLSSDLLLIGKKDAIEKQSLNPLLSKITRNLLHSNQADVQSICANNGIYPLSVSSTLRSSCNQYQNELQSSGEHKGEVIVALDLLRQANSIEEIEIYNDALRHNKAVGGLSYDTEVAKLKQVHRFYKNAHGSKLIIKSYVNSNEGDAYQNAQFIFKQLRKMGINRGDMILKSFNQSTFCHNNQKAHCNFLNRKILFEFLN